MSYIERIDIVYGENDSQIPANALRPSSGSPNFNDGYGGKHVWFVPVRTNDKAQAASWLELFYFTDKPDPSGKYKNICEGAKGGYRYVVARKKGGDHDADLRVVDVMLVRNGSSFPGLGSALSLYKEGKDLNTDRNGDYIYLATKLGA